MSSELPFAPIGLPIAGLEPVTPVWKQWFINFVNTINGSGSGSSPLMPAPPNTLVANTTSGTAVPSSVSQLNLLNIIATNPKYGKGKGDGCLYLSANYNSSASGTGPYAAAYFVVNDTGAQLTGPYGQTLGVDGNWGGSTLTGSRATARFTSTLTAPTGNTLAGPNTTYGAIDAYCTLSASDNGTGLTTTTARGGGSSANFITTLSASATNIYACTTQENGLSMEYGSSAAITRCLGLVKQPASQAQGTLEDSALSIGSQTPIGTFTNVACVGTAGQFTFAGSGLVVGAAVRVVGTDTNGIFSGFASPSEYYVSATDGVSTFTLQTQARGAVTTVIGAPAGLAFSTSWGTFGWDSGIAIASPNPGNWPYAWDATLLRSYKSGICKTGIDLSLCLFSGYSLNLPGFQVDPAGNLVTCGAIDSVGASIIGGGLLQLNVGSSDGATDINTGSSTHNTNIGNANGGFVQMQGPMIISENLGFSANTWGVNGLAFGGNAQTLIDLNGTSVVTEAACAFPAYTIDASNAMTLTNLVNLYLPAPLAGHNISGETLYAVWINGRSHQTGTTETTTLTNVGGAVSLNASSNFNVNINTGSSTGTTTIGNAASSLAVKCSTKLSSTFAINGGTPTAQLTGFGSPSGSPTASLTNASTLAQTAGTLAALLAYLETTGFIGA